MSEPPALAIDIGGTKTAAGLVARDGGLLAAERAPTLRERGPEAALGLAASLAERVMRSSPARPAAAGLALPGLTDPESGLFRGSPSAGWPAFDFAGRLEAALGLPFRADNDVRASALAELRFGLFRDREARAADGLRPAPPGPPENRPESPMPDAARPLPSFLWITISTGIGGALALDGRIHLGSGGAAGEIGHLTVNPGGEACGCGRRGCLEAEASGAAIAKKARRALAGGASSILSAGGGREIDARAVAEAARAGDRLSIAIFEEAGASLGIALAAASTLLDMDRFIIGGGVSSALDLLAPAAEEAFRRCVFDPESRSFSLLSTALGHDAALLGAAALAFSAKPRRRR